MIESSLKSQFLPRIPEFIDNMLFINIKQCQKFTQLPKSCFSNLQLSYILSGTSIPSRPIAD